MLLLAIGVVIGAVVLFAGTQGVPFTISWFKSWSASRALADAKALIAQAEADAAALDTAKKVVAAAAPVVVVFPTKAPSPVSIVTTTAPALSPSPVVLVGTIGLTGPA